MSNLTLARLLILLPGVALIVFDLWRARRSDESRTLADKLLLLIAVANVIGVGYLVIRQFNFPLHLDLMEGTVLQHFVRASNGEAIYPEAAPEYVPLAYNVGYYVFSIPFGWIFGVNVGTLRLVALLGMIGSVGIVTASVWQYTRSRWWSVLGLGLFAAAYWAMDAYLNTAHSDSWFLFTALLGSYIISRSRAYPGRIAAVFLLVAAFWFKQHGAWFTIGGVLFLTWQEMHETNWRSGAFRSWPYWVIAAVFGPGLYLLLGPTLFGSDYHYFTLTVPGAWSELSIQTFLRLGSFIFRNYLILAIISGLSVLWVVFRRIQDLSIWQTQVVFAVLAGFMGALDSGSSNNVFIPMGAFFIIVGTQALYTASMQITPVKNYRLHMFALLGSFAIFLFDPAPFLTSPQAADVYEDFVATMQALDGPLYAPWQAYLGDEELALYPGAHWVAIEDMIRGPGHETKNHPVTRAMLEPLLSPTGPAYMLTNKPLENWPMFMFLLDYLVIEEDFQERFIALELPPKRFDHGYPRYLYRYDPELAASMSNS